MLGEIMLMNTREHYQVSHDRDVRWLMSLIILGLLMQIFIVWSCKYPPLRDLPAHIARNYLEYQKISGQQLPVYYAIDYKLIPNLGSDLVLPFLMYLFSPLVAAKIFLSFTVVIYWLGPALFIITYQAKCSDGFNKGSLAAAAILLPLTINNTFLYGNINYHSGIGISFFVLTHFLRIKDRRYIDFFDIFFHTTLVTLLYFWHLFAFGIYCIIVSSFVICDMKNCLKLCSLFYIKKYVPIFITWIPALLLLVFYVKNGFIGVSSGKYIWGTFSRKIIVALSIFRSYELKIDLIVICVIILISLWGWRFRFKSIGKRRNFRILPIHLSLMICVFLYILLPVDLGSTSGVDFRLLPAILICGVAACGPFKFEKYITWIVVMLFCLILRNGSILIEWTSLGNRLFSHSKAFSIIEPGSKVLPIIKYNDKVNVKERVEEHFPSWGIIEKQIFCPNIFAKAWQQPLSINEPYSNYVKEAFKPGKTRLDKSSYDYYWVYSPTGELSDLPLKASLVFSEECLKLYKLR